MYATVAVLSVLTSTCLPRKLPLRWFKARHTALGNWCASAVEGPSKTLTLHAHCTWPPSQWYRHPCKPQHAWRPVPGALLPGEMQGLTTGWRFGGRPVLKRSYMKQPQWRDCCSSCHMPQEPLKLFQWDRRPALEHIRAVQHRLSTFLCEACCLYQIQLHTEKKDPLCRVEFALFFFCSSWPKAQQAEVWEHQVPVFAQLIPRLS